MVFLLGVIMQEKSNMTNKKEPFKGLNSIIHVKV